MLLVVSDVSEDRLIPDAIRAFSKKEKAFS